MRGINRMMRVLLVGVFSIIVFVLDTVAKVYSLVISWFYIVLFICAIIALLMKQWTSIVILVSMFVLSLGIVFCIGLIIAFIEVMKERLLCKR